MDPFCLASESPSINKAVMYGDCTVGDECWTIGPLLSQRFLLPSAKAQPRGGFYIIGNGIPAISLKSVTFIFQISDLTRHWLGHQLRKTLMECDTCSFKTDNRDVIDEHMRDHYRYN